MDRIDRFLNRRPQKNKKRINVDGRIYTVTKEDVKKIKSYRNNVCLDPDVNLYLPNYIEYSKTVMETPLVDERQLTKNLKLEKKHKKQRKNYNKEKISVPDKNEILDIWEEAKIEDIENYEHDFFMKIDGPYSGSVDELKFTEEHLKKSFRTIYLQLYEPREHRQYKIKNLIAKTPEPETLKPFPEEIAQSYGFNSQIIMKLSFNGKKIAVAEENKLFVFLSKNFLKIKAVDFDTKVKNIYFTPDESICVLLDGNLCIVDDVYDGNAHNNLASYSVENFLTWSFKFPSENKIKGIPEDVYKDESGQKMVAYTMIKPNKKITDVAVYPNGNYICIISGTKIICLNLENRTSFEIKMDKDKLLPEKIMFYSNSPNMVIGCRNKVMIYNFLKKDFKYVSNNAFVIQDMARIVDDVIVWSDNVASLCFYDIDKETILAKKDMEDVAHEVVQHRRYNLLCVALSNELIIFYNSIGDNIFTCVKTIPGKFTNINFHPTLPWIYAVKGSNVVLIT